jgi:hypothetical protein
MAGKIADQNDPQVYFQHTDQFIAMENIRKGRTGAKVEVTDRFDMQLDAREAAGRGSIEPWDAPEPLKEASDSIPRPGFVRRFLSEMVMKRRGKRGFEVVKDERGDPVKVADMVMAEMPISKAERRNEHYREEGNRAIREAEAHAREQQEKLIRDGNVVGVQPLKPGETVRDSADGSRVATSGLLSHTGNSHFLDEAA